MASGAVPQHSDLDGIAGAFRLLWVDPADVELFGGDLPWKPEAFHLEAFEKESTCVDRGSRSCIWSPALASRARLESGQRGDELRRSTIEGSVLGGAGIFRWASTQRCWWTIVCWWSPTWV